MQEEQKILKAVGKKLKQERNKNGLSLRDIELATGVSNSYISQIERADVKCPSFFSIFRLCQFFELSLDDLYANENPQEKIKIAA